MNKAIVVLVIVFISASIATAAPKKSITYTGDTVSLTPEQQEVEKWLGNGKNNPSVEDVRYFQGAFPNFFKGIKDEQLKSILQNHGKQITLQFGRVVLQGSQRSENAVVDLLTTVSVDTPVRNPEKFPGNLNMGSTRTFFTSQGVISFVYNKGKLTLAVNGFSEKNPAMLRNAYAQVDYNNGKLQMKLTPQGGQPSAEFPDGTLVMPQGGYITDGACIPRETCSIPQGKQWIIVLGEVSVLTEDRVHILFPKNRPPKMYNPNANIPPTKSPDRVETLPSQWGRTKIITDGSTVGEIRGKQK